MHFIGMLAIQSPAIVDYLVLPTLISFLVCVLVTGVAIYMASLQSQKMIFGAALVMGIGIAAMHFIGMAALNSSALMHGNPVYVVASIMLAVATSGLALWLAFIANTRFPLILGAVVFGFAVSGMHYLAMAGMSMHFTAEPPLTSSYISSDILAIIVSVVAFLISAIFMLALIPKDTPSDPRGASKQTQLSSLQYFSDSDHITPVVEDPAPTVSYIPQETLIPIEKNGNSFQIALADIVSIHANAHYTYIFNGREDFFCPLSISEIDDRIGSDLFFRTHRSNIVNLGHVARVQKSGDAALVELHSTIRRSVPVARGRVGQLRKEWANYKAHRLLTLP